MLLSRLDVPRPSSAARQRALRLLEASLGPSKVLTAPESCQAFLRDESEAEGTLPDAVVLAESAEDIRKALAVAREAEVPITPRAAGTGRTAAQYPSRAGWCSRRSV